MQAHATPGLEPQVSRNSSTWRRRLPAPPWLAASVVIVLACSFSPPAAGQWQWVDKDGRRVFSDKAPPPEVPDKNILRRPGMRSSAPAPEAAPTAAAAAAPAAAAAAPAAAAAASPPKPAGRDRELEEKKKQAEQAAEAKKKEAAEQVAKAQAENCTRARQAKATYDSGARVARVNAKGEREIMDDKARADEVKRLEAVIARDCKAA